MRDRYLLGMAMLDESSFCLYFEGAFFRFVSWEVGGAVYCLVGLLLFLGFDGVRGVGRAFGSWGGCRGASNLALI